jgi:hypothetical protein
MSHGPYSLGMSSSQLLGLLHLMVVVVVVGVGVMSGQ